MRKLAIFAFSFFAAAFAYQSVDLTAWLLGAVVTALFLGILFIRDSWKFRLILVAMGLAAGFLWNLFYDEIFIDPARDLNGETAVITAEVKDYPDVTEYGVYVKVGLKTDGAAASALLRLDEGFDYLTPGDVVTVTASLYFADNIYGEETDYYMSSGIFLRAYQVGDAEVSSGGTLALKYIPAYLAHAVREKIKEIFPENAAGFVISILTGDKSGLTGEFYASLKASGAVHIVAVSGMHVTFLVGFLTIFIGKRKRAAMISIPVILLFMAFVGNTPSVVRAGVMQIIVLIAPLIKRESDTLTSLGAALLILLAINPYSASNVGLQLSFASILGLAFISNPMYNALFRKASRKEFFKRKPVNILLRFLISGLSASVGVMVLTAPIMAVHFGYISLLSPLTNILILWIVSFIFGGSIIACILGFVFTPLGIAAAWVIARCVRYVEFICGLISALPFSVLYTLNEYIRIWLAAVYIIFGIFFSAKTRGRPLIPVSLSAILLCVCLLLGAVETDTGSFTVTALDVGQGQSIVLGAGDYVVVDCGGRSGDAAGQLAAEYLFSKNVYRLELLVLTHFDADHVNGVPALLGMVDVGALVIPPENVSEEKSYRETILTMAEELDIEIIEIASNTTFYLDGNVLRVFAPVGYGDENETGISALYTSGSFDVLITGDMSSTSERRLLNSAQLPDIELLITGHHGSKYSTSNDLLEALLPETAIISVGGGNMYGHPHEEVIERLLENNVYIYRTDIYGNVTVKAG